VIRKFRSTVVKARTNRRDVFSLDIAFSGGVSSVYENHISSNDYLDQDKLILCL
jgi:hypothetical protein